MKLEHVTIDDMLRSYLKSNFANRNTLVIWPLSWCDSEAEVETIKQDLFEFGYLPPKSYCRNGFWIIEMPTHTAFEIINRHSKGTLAMRCYCGDECLHENMWLFETYVKSNISKIRTQSQKAANGLETYVKRNTFKPLPVFEYKDHQVWGLWKTVYL